MDLDNAKLKVASTLWGLLSSTQAQNSKYVVSVSGQQKSLRCEKIFYLIILYCLDFYNELSEELKYKIQEIVNELEEPDENFKDIEINGSIETIEIPEEYQCLGITVLEYFLENLDTVLDECKSECYCQHNVINCFVTFMIAVNLLTNHREKEGKLLMKFVEGQISNIYREGVEYSGAFTLTEDQELYRDIKCPVEKCYVDTDNADTMFEFFTPTSFNLEIENCELYGNK